MTTTIQQRDTKLEWRWSERSDAVAEAEAITISLLSSNMCKILTTIINAQVNLFVCVLRFQGQSILIL